MPNMPETNTSGWTIHYATKGDRANPALVMILGLSHRLAHWGRLPELLAEKLLPACRYYAYVQVAEEEQNLWEEYARLTETHKQFAIRKAISADQIYPVFRDLFKKQGAPR